MNPTATLVVRTLLDGGEETDAAAALIREFDIDQKQALQDVGTLVRQLRDSGLAR